MIPRPLAIGGVLIGASLCLAIFPAAFAPYDSVAFDYNALMQAPTLAHPMGTDNFGRDVLSRVIHAYQIDMQIAFFGTVFSFVFGVLTGAYRYTTIAHGVLRDNMSILAMPGLSQRRHRQDHFPTGTSSQARSR